MIPYTCFCDISMLELRNSKRSVWVLNTGSSRGKVTKIAYLEGGTHNLWSAEDGELSRSYPDEEVASQ